MENPTPDTITIQAKKDPTKDQVIEISIILPTQAYFLSGIRDFTLNLIKNMTDFSEQWAFRFQSIVDELCNNAIEHGSRPGEKIEIIFETKGSEYIQIIVKDTGTSEKPLKAAQIRDMVQERKQQNIVNGLIRGRGLSKIVSEWTDELEFTDNEKGGISVRVKKLLNDPKLKAAMDNPSHIILN